MNKPNQTAGTNQRWGSAILAITCWTFFFVVSLGVFVDAISLDTKKSVILFAIFITGMLASAYNHSASKIDREVK